MLTKAEIVRLASLQEKKSRDALQLFAIEGEKVIGELLARRYPLVEIYATADWTAPIEHSGLRRVTPAEMKRISHFPTPSPVFAVARITRPALAADELDRGLTLALDGIQDAGNLGTLLRIADWFALDRVVVSPDGVDVFNRKVIHASMASFSRVPVFTAPLVNALASTRAPVLGCDLAGEDVHGIEPLRDAIIVIGSEGRGLSPTVRARLDRVITIPRYGAAESLNAGVAAAIVCDNLRRQAKPQS